MIRPGHVSNRPNMSFTLPLAIWSLSAFFREIPWEMEQAAQVDGAAAWQAFRKVIVPVGGARRLHRGDPGVLLRLEHFVLRDIAPAAARCETAQMAFFRRARPVQPAVLHAPGPGGRGLCGPVVLVLFFQRQIIAGLTSGAVKG